MLQQQQQEQYYDASLPSSSMNVIVMPSPAESSSSSSSSSVLKNDSGFANLMSYASSPPDYTTMTTTTASLSSLSSSSNRNDNNNKNILISYKNELPKNDFSQLIDLDNFEFLMNPKTCKDLEQQPLVVILIHSSPDNDHKRQTIRETWGMNDSRALLLFLIGSVNNSPTIEEKVNLENQAYGDIVQGNFNDAYRNLTYKHVAALKWFIYYCPHVRYLLKTDDDVFVNSPLMYSMFEKTSSVAKTTTTSSTLLNEWHKLHRGNLIYCHEIERAKVKRTFRSKWRVSFDEYPEKYFPSHCPGFVILYSSDVVIRLYKQAQKLSYFWIDDVHITGTVASKLNISITSFENLYLKSAQQKELLNCEVNNTIDDDDDDDDRLVMIKTLLTPTATVPLTESSFIFSQPNLTEMEIRKLWKFVRKTTMNNNNTINSTLFSSSKMLVRENKHKNANENEVVESKDDNTIQI